MTLEEYQKAKMYIELKARQEQNALAKEYALSNNTVNVGDIVQDHLGLCLAEKISFSYSHGIPVCVYIGPRLTVQGKPFKNKETRHVYQSNLHLAKKGVK